MRPADSNDEAFCQDASRSETDSNVCRLAIITTGSPFSTAGVKNRSMARCRNRSLS